jgi:pimeloyl-ACP methyl ester carboxylesterase
MPRRACPAPAEAPALRFARTPGGTPVAWARSGHGAPLVRVAHWLTHVEREAASPIWKPWLERYDAIGSLIRYDERGYGLSGHDDEPPGLEKSLADLHAVIEASGEPRVALFGVSGAAPIAIAYAARHPQRVSRLLLLGGFLAGLVARGGSPEALQWHEAQLRLMELGWGRDDPSVQQFFTATLVPDASAEEMKSLNELQRLACNGAQAAGFLRMRAALDVRALAPQVRCPALVLHAAHDRVVAHAAGRELAAALPGARFVTLDTRNHVPLPSDPALPRLFEAMGAFLREDAASTLQPTLTPRERALAACVAQGLDNLQIAARLGVRDKTVRNALSLLYAKLQVEGRPQAVVRARELGLGP